jgi:hypothetical protein
MTDIQIIHDFILNKVYDKVLLEVTLSKITDKRLISGFLIDLSTKADLYEALCDGSTSKADIDEMAIQLCVSGLNITKSNIDSLIDILHQDNIYFRALLKEISSKIVKKAEIHKSLTILLLENKIDEFKKELENVSLSDLKGFKKLLIESEIFESVSMVDDEINKQK